MYLLGIDSSTFSHCEIATKELAARLAVEALDDSLSDAINTFHGILHLARFHALTVNLYHPVLAVHIYHIAIGQLAHDIVGVQPSVLIELSSALRVFIIALAEVSLHDQFTLFAVSYWFAIIAQQHPFCWRVWRRATHRCRLVRLIHLIDEYRAHRLRHTIVIEQGITITRTLVDHLLTTRIYHFQRCRTVMEISQHSRTDKGMGNAVLLDIVFQLLHIKTNIASIKMQLSPTLEHGEV